jgi:hypothetical protein
MRRALLTVLLAASLAAGVAASAPAASAPSSCGTVDGKKGVSAEFITATGTGCNTARKVAAGYLPGGKKPAGRKYKNKAGKVTATKKNAKVTFALAD